MKRHLVKNCRVDRPIDYVSSILATIQPLDSCVLVYILRCHTDNLRIMGQAFTSYIGSPGSRVQALDQAIKRLHRIGPPHLRNTLFHINVARVLYTLADETIPFQDASLDVAC